MRQITPARTEITSKGGPVKIPQVCVFEKNELTYSRCNRPVLKRNVEGLHKSVTQYGLLRDVVVARLNGQYIVVDGQNLKEALELMDDNFPIIGKVVEVRDEVELYQLITRLNTAQVRFSFKNFIHGWAELNDDYRIIIELGEKYKIVNTVLGSILTGLPLCRAKETIKNGTFTITSLEVAKRKVSWIYTLASSTQLPLDRYGSEGLNEFINSVGITPYANFESQFTERLKQYVINNDLIGVKFGETSQYIKLFRKIWSEL